VNRKTQNYPANATIKKKKTERVLLFF